MADPAVKKYYDYAQQQIDEQAILDKYNAATVAQFNVQREQNRQAENQFYNEMYNTQKTAMDTIRQSNAAAVASGASRGVQAAQELSSLLGLQQESVASATELAQANRQTAQEETAAVLENVLNAYKQATDERGQLVSRAIEAAQVEADTTANQQAAEQANVEMLQSALKESTNSYFLALQKQGKDYSKEYSIEGEQSLLTAQSRLQQEIQEAKDADQSAAPLIQNYLNTVKLQYGLSNADLYAAFITEQSRTTNSTPEELNKIYQNAKQEVSDSKIDSPRFISYIYALAGQTPTLASTAYHYKQYQNKEK